MTGRLLELPPSLQDMVGPTSIVRSVRTILNAPGEVPLYSVSSVPNSFERIAGADMAGNSGAMAETWHDAAAAAVGECIERYSCAVQPHDTVVATARELGDAALTVDDFELFGEQQYAHPDFPFPRHTVDLPMVWVPMTRVPDGAERFIPACLAYIPYEPVFADRSDMVALAVSSGQACHTSRELAMLSGILEVVERDAFMLTWVRRLTPTRLTIAPGSDLDDWYRHHLANGSLTFDLFRLPSDISLPTVLCVARGISDQGEFACVGAATRLDEASAARKAMVEAAQGSVWVRDLISTLPDWRPEPHYVNVRDFPDHVRLYGLPDMVRHLDFLYEGPTAEVAPPQPKPPVAEALARSVRAVNEVGLDVLVRDLAPREIAEAGLSVVRVMIPRSVQLYATHGLPNFGATRLTSVPAALGFDGARHQTYNPIPHPFP